MLLLMLGVASSAWAAGYSGGVPWQVGDVVICFGTGTCNVVRVSGTPMLLDQFSDGLSGDTRGVAINNTLHAVVTDNAGSNVKVYSIASVVPFTGATIAHTPVNTFTTSGSNAQAVVVGKTGHIFVGNAGTGVSPAPSIVELNPDGSLPLPVSSVLPSNPYPLAGCIDTGGHLLSMDLSKDGTALYLTSNSGAYSTSTSNGGNIQKVTLSGCTAFASFGPGVALNGIQDVPAGALAGVAPNCNGTPCPTSRDTILVVAEGFFDSDGDPTGEPPIPDQADDTNICTNVTDVVNGSGPLVSCALLLDTGGPGLTESPWVAGGSYNTGDKVLDANLHVQQVTSDAGTSGFATPAWSTNGGTTNDGTLTWTDQGTSVVARYPVTSKNTLQALSLDPLVRDCSGINEACSTSVPTVSNFWLGDNSSSNFYKLDFATGASGTPTALDANANAFGTSGVCLTCSTASGGIQGLRIYGAEGANQADLTKLLFNGDLGSAPANTASVTFPVGASGGDLNTWTLTEYSATSSPLPSSTPITLYASLIDMASAPTNGNNSGATDRGALRVNNTSFTNPVPCDATTTDLSKCIIWKADVTVPSGTYLSETINSPTRIDSGTDLFIDLHYDVTTTPGVEDCCLTSGGSKGSVHSLHEVPTTFTTGGTNPSGCVYSSPVADACYKTNRSTLNFTFQCSGLGQQTFANLQSGPPDLSLVRRFPGQTPKPAPKIIALTGTNGKAPYRYSTSGPAPSYTFQWNLNKAATSNQIDLNGKDNVRGCTFDPTGTVQTFCVDFTTSPTCK